MKVVLVTNDFPPRVGGIQSYLWNLYSRLAARGVDVTVLAPRFDGDAAFDARAGTHIVRWPHAVAWPTPALRRQVQALARDADVVTFGAVLPMDLLASSVDRPVLVHTHGFEVAWARVPGMRHALRRIARASGTFTVVSDFTRRIIERAVGEHTRIEMLRTGVDVERFHPGIDAADMRKRYGLNDRPVVSCVSRLVGRKGQDQLIRALPAVRAAVPDVALLIVGRGPARETLQRMARQYGVDEHVVFAGEVSDEDLPAHYAAGDVFAMPCRSRYAGLEVEGLGLVYLEAQACARPAVTGDSGGAPEAVIAGETGAVVGGTDTEGLARALAALLGDRARAHAMGLAGRRFVLASHRWEDVVDRLDGMLGDLAR